MNQNHPADVMLAHRQSDDNAIAGVDPSETQLLAQLDEAGLMLETVSQADEAKYLYDGFSAASEFAKRRKYSHAAQVATAGRIRAGRRLGQIIPNEFPRGGDPMSSRTTLADVGITRDQSSRFQKLATVPDVIFEAAIQEAETEVEGELTEAGILARADRILRGRSVQQSENNEWYTPRDYIVAVHAVMGGIDLDPASNETANEIVQAAEFYTLEDDGLSRLWKGRVFLNPPYGRLAGQFVERLVDDFGLGQVTAGIVLVNAHCTDTAWFQCLWDGVLCFTDHRIDFYRPGSKTKNQSTHGSAFAYFGPEPERFAVEFATFGPIVRRFP